MNFRMIVYEHYPAAFNVANVPTLDSLAPAGIFEVKKIVNSLKNKTCLVNLYSLQHQAEQLHRSYNFLL